MTTLSTQAQPIVAPKKPTWGEHRKTSLTWPWPVAQQALGYFVGGDMYDITGGTGSNKSRVAMKLAQHWLKVDKAAGLYWGTELPGKSLIMRMFLEHTGIDVSENLLKTERWDEMPEGTEAAWAHYQDRWEKSGAARRLQFLDDVCPKFDDSIAIIESMKGKIQFVVFDHTGQFLFPGRGAGHEKEKAGVALFKQTLIDCDIVGIPVIQQKGVEAHALRSESMRGSAAWGHAATGIIEVRQPIFQLDKGQQVAFMDAVRRGECDADAVLDRARLNINAMKSRDMKNGKGTTLKFAWDGLDLVDVEPEHLEAADERRDALMARIGAPRSVGIVVDPTEKAQAAAEREARRKDKDRKDAMSFRRRIGGSDMIDDLGAAESEKAKKQVLDEARAVNGMKPKASYGRAKK